MPGDKPFEWVKGRTLVSYRDKEHGLRLRLYIQREADAEKILRKVCDIANTTFDETLMNISKCAAPSEAFPTHPKRIRILGESFFEPRKRPIGTVKFAYALCKIWGRNKPVVLCKAYNYFRQSLVD